MGTPEEAMAATTTTNTSSSDNEQHSHAIVKGKRTKRQRLLHVPAPVAAAASSSSSSGEFSGSTTEEEEDMANCLILLAQGRALDAGSKPEAQANEEGDGCSDGGGGGSERFTSRKYAEAATTTNGKAGFYVYECKTCNKCFPSFQALGGHRSSHKKPKMVPVTAVATEEKKEREEDGLQISINVSGTHIPPCNNAISSTAVPPLNSTGSSSNNNNNNSANSSAHNNKSRVHECSICGSEFSSGQALGGHMRRHRTAITVDAAREVKKEKSILSLDLNLPAPSDEERGDFPKSPSFTFGGAGNQPSFAFSASALVDCHY